MKFTVVTPSFNQGQYVGETIESVLSQEGDFELEYFVVEDGSTDGSQGVIESYAQKMRDGSFPIRCKGVTFSWWTQKGKGQTEAINDGWQHASGELVGWLNSDDVYEPGALAAIAEAHRKNPDASFYHGDVFFNNEVNGTRDLRKGSDVTLYSLTVQGAQIYQPGMFSPLAPFKTMGLLDGKLRYVMDYDLWIRSLRRAPAQYVPFTLATFRIWKHSNTHSKREGFARETQEVRRRYGLPRLYPKTIHYSVGANPISRFVRKSFPGLYGHIKRAFYAIIARIKY